MWQTFWNSVKSRFAGKGGTAQIGAANRSVSTDEDSGAFALTDRNIDATLPSIVLPEIDGFTDLEGKMSVLFNDLCRILANHPNVRELAIIELNMVTNLSRPAISLKEEKYINIHALMEELESREHIKNVSMTAMKQYRMSEGFAQYLRRRSVTG